jgi:hypothetical protein
MRMFDVPNVLCAERDKHEQCLRTNLQHITLRFYAAVLNRLLLRVVWINCVKKIDQLLLSIVCGETLRIFIALIIEYRWLAASSCFECAFIYNI